MERRAGVPDRRSNFFSAVESYIRQTPSFRDSILAPLLEQLRVLERQLRDEADYADHGSIGNQEAAILDECADRVKQIRKMFAPKEQP